MGVTAMRYLMIATASMFLMLPATAPAKASDAAQYSAKAVTADYSAKKHKKHKKPAEKVEYMRAALMK
jgi:ABC-type transporter MlaC component